jgi:hypothetical protein
MLPSAHVRAIGFGAGEAKDATILPKRAEAGTPVNANDTAAANKIRTDNFISTPHLFVTALI